MSQTELKRTTHLMKLATLATLVIAVTLAALATQVTPVTLSGLDMCKETGGKSRRLSASWQPDQELIDEVKRDWAWMKQACGLCGWKAEGVKGNVCYKCAANCTDSCAASCDAICGSSDTARSITFEI